MKTVKIIALAVVISSAFASVSANAADSWAAIFGDVNNAFHDNGVNVSRAQDILSRRAGWNLSASQVQQLAALVANNSITQYDIDSTVLTKIGGNNSQPVNTPANNSKASDPALVAQVDNNTNAIAGLTKEQGNQRRQIDGVVSVVSQQQNDIDALKNQPKPTNGIDGKDGKDGATGAQGLKGDRGETGLTGKTGKSGVDGKDGLNGKDGVTTTITKVDTATQKQVADNKSRIETNSADIISTHNEVATNRAEIIAHSRAINQNANAINQNSQRIDRNSKAISKNAADIQHNKKLIKQIGNNAAAMSSLHFNANRDSWALSTGSAGNGVAFAAGVQKSVSDHAAVTVQASFDSTGGFMVGAGIHGDF